MTMDRKEHWETVYRSKAHDSVSWYESMPRTSLELVGACGLHAAAGIIDVGAGASALVDGLLERGHSDVSVLDVSAAALEAVKARLGDRASRVSWIVSDVTEWEPARSYHLWHDRAVLHFLATPEDREAYRSVLERSIERGGWVILATFAAGGPLRCSGLDVIRYSGEDLAGFLGAGFQMERGFTRIHRTPSAADQAFQWGVFRRV